MAVYSKSQDHHACALVLYSIKNDNGKSVPRISEGDLSSVHLTHCDIFVQSTFLISIAPFYYPCRIY